MNKAWVISVNMGYGHQRTAYPLRGLTFGEKIINANSYKEISEKDRKIWEGARKSYEFISAFGRFPLIGRIVFSIFDEFQKILSYYPKRDLSKPNFQLRQTFFLIKNGWGKDLIEKLKNDSLSLDAPPPLITTFFTPAFMAEFFDYPGEIYCVICDADISRTWAPLNPAKSRIKYLAPTSWVVNRLKLYGVKEENILFTGYPLPTENIGTKKLEVLKDDLKNRIVNLDPRKSYLQRYRALIDEYLDDLPLRSNHPLTIMFSVGGAGLQKEIGIKIIKSLIQKIKSKKVKIILSAGIKKEVKEYFIKNIKKLGLINEQVSANGIEILFEKDIKSYFQKFNSALRTTDILWTKPSELSFYAGLGIPIIIAPPVGSQEDFNKKWLLGLGSAVIQEDPDHADQWLFDFLDSGRFCEAAMQGFIDVEKLGTFNIEKICLGS